VVCSLGVGFCVVLGDHGQKSKGVEAEAAVCFNGEGCEVVVAVLVFCGVPPPGLRGLRQLPMIG